MKKILYLLLCSFFIFTSCSDDEKSETAPYLRIPDNVKSLHYLKDIQRENIKIETNCEDWEITSDQMWCDVHRIVSNSEVFRLALEENDNIGLREAKLTLKGSGITETIIVKQLGTEPAVLVNPEKLDDCSEMKADYDLTITTNVPNITWDIPEKDKSWLSVKVSENEPTRSMVESKYTLTVESNNLLTKRTSVITFIGNDDEGKHPSADLTVIQRKRSTDPGDIDTDDIKIVPINAWASTEQPSQPIANSFDNIVNDNDKPYHTNWNASSWSFPISLEYYFYGPQEMDYVIFYPNGNGRFKEFTIYYLDGGNTISFDQNVRPETCPSEGREWKEIQSYTLENRAGSKRIMFPERLSNVVGIKFEVKSSHSGDKAACNEMEFYRSTGSFLDAQLLTVFKDITCCELNKDVTDDMINELPGYFAQLAYKIKDGSYSEWEKKFRIQEYKPYSSVEEMSKAVLIKKYGNQDNITGVYVEEGQNIIVLVGETYGNNISLQILGEEDGSGYYQTESPDAAQTVELLKGVNKIKVNKTGMLFILYAADPTDAQNKPIRIHIPYESGKVSGFFDLETDKTDEVYADLLNKANYKYFGVKGKDIIFYFHTSKLREVSQHKIVEAINLWDNIVGWQHELMGFTGDLRKRYNNHVFAISPEGGYMWQSEYRVAFVYTYLNNILLPENVLAKEDNAWGPAHEIGHIHQKAINWPGCSESSNNLFSNYVILKMGEYYSRGYGLNRVAKTRFTDNDPWAILGELPTYNAEKGLYEGEETELHMRMYWQLYTYYHECKNRKDFWPTVFRKMREKYNGYYTEQEPGKSQMKFVEAVCEAANEDLTDFFDFWGFFTPVDIKIEQYGTFNYTVTESEINSIKSRISNYKKAAPIQYIEDRKKQWFTGDYRSQELGDVGFMDQFKGTAVTFADDAITATLSGKDVSVNTNTGANAVAFEVRKGNARDGELVYFSNDFSFTLPNNIKVDEIKLWAVQADGARKSIKVN